MPDGERYHDASDEQKRIIKAMGRSGSMKDDMDEMESDDSRLHRNAGGDAPRRGR